MDMEVSGTGIEMGVKVENGVRWNECLYMWWIREMRRMGTLQGKRYMVTFITSHHKHKVSLQHSVTFSTDTIEGTNW